VKQINKDTSTAFFGGVYDHSNATQNVSSCWNGTVAQLLFMVRVGVLHGGVPHTMEKTWYHPLLACALATPDIPHDAYTEMRSHAYLR
jgi:hypothetical protein